MRVYKAVESAHDRRVKTVYDVTIGLSILLVGIVMGAMLAVTIALHYLLPDMIDPNAEVPISAFCSGGLVPEPGFCSKTGLQVLYVSQN